MTGTTLTVSTGNQNVPSLDSPTKQKCGQGSGPVSCPMLCHFGCLVGSPLSQTPQQECSATGNAVHFEGHPAQPPKPALLHGRARLRRRAGLPSALCAVARSHVSQSSAPDELPCCSAPAPIPLSGLQLSAFTLAPPPPGQKPVSMSAEQRVGGDLCPPLRHTLPCMWAAYVGGWTCSPEAGRAAQRQERACRWL